VADTQVYGNPDPVITRTTALTELACEVKLLYGAFHDEDGFKPLPLLIAIRRQYHLRWDGIHGIGHWKRVWRIGEALAEQAGADRSVVRAFAFLHDACQLLDSTDPDHGRSGPEAQPGLSGTDTGPDGTPFHCL
jgi:hypothetical protein